MLYHQVADKIPTFKPQLLEEVCLGHISGGLNNV